MQNSNRKKIVYVVLAVSGLYSMYVGYQKYTAIPQYNRLEAVAVMSNKAELRFMQRRDTVAGRVEADSSVMLMSDIAGRVKKININEGQMVKKGTILLELENSYESSQVDSYTAEVDRLKSQVDRAKALYENQDIPLAALKDKEAELSSTIAKKKQAQATLDKTYIKAPFDGILGLRNVNLGAQVQPNTDIVKITTLDKLRVKFSVSVDRMPYITEGNIVDVLIGEEELPLEATIIAKEADLHQNTHQVEVVASLNNKDGNIIPGQYARVMITTSKEENVVAVPESSLIRDEEDKIFVFKVKQGIVNKVSVELGPRYGDGFVEISNGIKEGEEIIVNVGESKTVRISDGMPVKIVTDSEI